MPTITLCHVDDVPEAGARGFDVGGDSLFAVKRDGQIYLYRNACPHLGVELNWLEHQFLDREAALIQCSTHGALFEIDTGTCIAGPCRGQRLQAVAYQLCDGNVKIAGDLPLPD